MTIQLSPRMVRLAALLGTAMVLTGCAPSRETAAAREAAFARPTMSVGAGDGLGQSMFANAPAADADATATADVRE
jgi:hypothetical protein